MSTTNSFPELGATLREIREQIRRKLERAASAAPEEPLPALEALKEVQRQVANLAGAIGTLNPRPPGLANELIQSGKRTLARASEWQLRPQREFNRNVAESLAKIAEALAALNRNLSAIQDQSSRKYQELGREVDSLCQQITLQRWAYEGALLRQTHSLEQFRERLEQELRSLKQRVALQAKADATRADSGVSLPASGETAARALGIDYFRLEQSFRGSEEEIRTRQRFYLPFFHGRRNVLDIACGRGEFLELMREALVPARGVDLDADMVGACLEKGLDVVRADAFAYLESLPDGSLDGIFSAQFIEHLESADCARLIRLCAAKLAPGGLLAIETPNPECLAIFSQTFFLDPTHVRPIPAGLLQFLFAEAGLERISAHFLSPVKANLPVLPELAVQGIEPDALRAYNAAVAKFNETFFGGMDYAVIGFRRA